MPSLVAAVPRLELESQRSSTGPPGRVLQEWHDEEGRLIATGGHDAGSWWMHWLGLATFWFGEEGPVRVTLVDPRPASQIEDVFTRGVIPTVLLARGVEALHASAIRDDRGVIGFCGRSGTGKSTLAFAIGSMGLRHIADDTLAYTFEHGNPFALELPFPARVDDQARAAMGRTMPASEGADSGGLSRIRRIYHLRRDGTIDPHRPHFTALAPTKGFEVLLSHAHPFDLSGEKRREAMLEHLLALAREVEVWECVFSPNLQALPSLAASVRSHAASQ